MLKDCKIHSTHVDSSLTPDIFPHPLIGDIYIYIYIYPLNRQSKYKVIYELICWLSGSLTCRLLNVITSPPARRSLVSSVTVD